MPVGDYFDYARARTHRKTFANCGRYHGLAPGEGTNTLVEKTIQKQTLLREGGTALIQGGGAVFYLVEYCWRPGAGVER